MKIIARILLALITFALLSLLITSCKRCQTCTQTSTISTSKPVQGYPIVTNTNIEACGADVDRINGMNTTSITDAGAFIITTTTSVKCK
jgi:hypothetical protein